MSAEKRKKAELLAPAGDYETFLGAIHAGADAVYIGGKKFGARAYADNLSGEEICRAVRYAHFFGRKLYLTLNTLVKEAEMAELYAYMAPFYEAGLDGVIVQDLGVMRWLRRQFPELPLHVSTQAAVTGPYGARLLKRLGAVRVVPARELSLQEIKELKELADIEVETFIHGALCYCYSGQCLFSSVLGGRSGNRGRCAQPCRLPYQDGDSYPLSLKDLCVIDRIPELVEAGIDSFKIEGRMKRAEYAAGVTAVYRSVIDRYYEAPDSFQGAEREERERLEQLYVRSGLQDGYYHRHNGRDMVTLHHPGYSGCGEAILADIRKRYLDTQPQLKIRGKAVLKKGQPAQLGIRLNGYEATAYGAAVTEARNRPLSEADILKQLQKTGGTPFAFEELTAVCEDDIFLPVKALNELRRAALKGLEDRLAPARALEGEQAGTLRKPAGQAGAKTVLPESTPLYVQTLTVSQAMAALDTGCIRRLYLPVDIFLTQEAAFAGVEKRLQEEKSTSGIQLYMVLPAVLRKRSERYLEKMLSCLNRPAVDGALVSNLEAYGWLSETGYEKPVVTDACLYVWNRQAVRFWEERGAQPTLPLELSGRELAALGTGDRELIVYGRIPMMVSANCVKNTLEGCAAWKSGANGAFFDLTDRLRKYFPVYANCLYCYNVIYNSLPMSLHPYAEKIRKTGGPWRLCLTVETGKETKEILRYYDGLCREGGETAAPPFKEYMKGYYKRGVE